MSILNINLYRPYIYNMYSTLFPRYYYSAVICILCDFALAFTTELSNSLLSYWLPDWWTNWWLWFTHSDLLPLRCVFIYVQSHSLEAFYTNSTTFCAIPWNIWSIPGVFHILFFICRQNVSACATIWYYSEWYNLFCWPEKSRTSCSGITKLQIATDHRVWTVHIQSKHKLPQRMYK